MAGRRGQRGLQPRLVPGPADNSWHELPWEHAAALGRPFSREAARLRAQARGCRPPVPRHQAALAELLDRWGAGLAGDNGRAADGDPAVRKPARMIPGPDPSPSRRPGTTTTPQPTSPGHGAPVDYARRRRLRRFSRARLDTDSWRRQRYFLTRPATWAQRRYPGHASLPAAPVQEQLARFRLIELLTGTTLLRTGPDGTITLTTGGERFARDVAPVLDMLAATGHWPLGRPRPGPSLRSPSRRPPAAATGLAPRDAPERRPEGDLRPASRLDGGAGSAHGHPASPDPGRLLPRSDPFPGPRARACTRRSR